MNKMKEIRLEKVTINMGCGEAGPKLEKAKKLLSMLTGKKIVVTKTHKRTTFGGAKKRPIGVKITLRGSDAKAFLDKALKSVEGGLKASQFDVSGNISFGIREYINMPGIKYDPEIGIMGMDVCVTLERAGYRVKRRMIRPSPVGRTHKITREESMEWLKKEFGAQVN